MHTLVMAGLVPAIHVFAAAKEDVDGRHKAGHDDGMKTG
jgi:hypothetical protein